MSIDQKELHMLGEMVEKILFDPEELNKLKMLITSVSERTIPARILKETILEFRKNMMNRILQLFPFYNKSLTNQKEIDNFGNGGSDAKKELEEKNDLLEHIGDKLHELEMRLQKEFVD